MRWKPNNDWVTVCSVLPGVGQVVFIEEGINLNDKMEEMWEIIRSTTQENMELNKLKLELMITKLTEPCRHLS